MRTLTKALNTVATTVALAIAGAAASAEKWDMPMAYAATNYHSEMGVVFADKVREYTGGEIDITVHPGGSLFKGGEIKRAVQTGQAPIGERFMSAHANEAPLLGWDNLPFIATTYEQNSALWAAAKSKVNAQLSDLNLVAEGPNLVISQPGSLIDNMDDWNKSQHSSSGLIEEVKKSIITERIKYVKPLKVSPRLYTIMNMGSANSMIMIITKIVAGQLTS